MSFDNSFYNVMSPCKDCTNRKPGCHDQCKDYNNWKEEYIEVKSKIYKERKINSTLYELTKNKYANIKGIKVVTSGW